MCVCVPSSWIDTNPFTIWQHRVIYHNISQLSVTEEAIDGAIHDYGQRSLRVWRIFQKVLEGKSIIMTIIGGSNSAGGGLPDHRQLYHHLFLQWWNRVILPCTGSKLILENVSLGGTGSDFFSLCLQNYLSQGKEPDFVLIELSVNDYGYLYGRSTEPMEWLTRRVLSLSSQPFVTYLTLVDLIEKVKWWRRILNPRCSNLEDLGQHEIARYYNITIFSWRDVVCPMNGGDSKRKIEIKVRMINEDHLHIGIKSHEQIALMLVRYTAKVFRKFLKLPFKIKPKNVDSIDDIAPLFMNISSQTKPYCWSLISKNWKKPGLTQTLSVRVFRHQGFREIAPQSPCAKMTNSGDRSDSFGGWKSEKAGSLIEFSFAVPKVTDKTSKWSVGLVLRRLQHGSLKVWLGANETNAVTITSRSYGRIGLQTRIYFLGVKIGSGSKQKIHIKTKAVKAGFEVKICGIVLGPADMKDIKQYKPTDTIQKVWSLEDYRKLAIDYTKGSTLAERTETNV